MPKALIRPGLRRKGLHSALETSLVRGPHEVGQRRRDSQDACSRLATHSANPSHPPAAGALVQDRCEDNVHHTVELLWGILQYLAQHHHGSTRSTEGHRD